MNFTKFKLTNLMRKILLFFALVLSFAMVNGQGLVLEVLNENFDGCEQPAGWTVDVDYAYGPPGGNIGVGSCSTFGSYLFSFNCTDGSTFYAPFNGDFSGCVAVIDDDNAFLYFDGIAYIYSPMMDISGGGLAIDFDYAFNALSSNFLVEVWDGAAWQVAWETGDGYNDGAGHVTVDISAYFNADFQVRFVHDDTGGTWAYGVAFDNVVVTANQPLQLEGNCYIDCPGDMNIYLDPGDCCWNVEYNARTIGCIPELTFDTILQEGGTPPAYGWVPPFDPTNFPEFDPNSQPTDWFAEWTLNGMQSTYGPSMIDISDIPNSLYLETFDSGPGCEGIGVDAYWNYTGPNFQVTNGGILSFEYHYTTGEDPFWDPLQYINTASFNPVNIYPQGFGQAWDYVGTFDITLNTGDHFFLAQRTLDFVACGSQSTIYNVVFGPAYVPKTGLYVRSGPANGDEICYGDVQEVELVLYLRDEVLDSCTFEIAVHNYPTPVSDLACNDEVQMSLDENCEVWVGADMILEGGPYSCYDDYIVEIEGVEGQIITQPGTYTVGIWDATGNNCWSTVIVEDKIPPTIDCAECPVGGELPSGTTFGNIGGDLLPEDLGANIRALCWDFGDHGHMPEYGVHYYDQYRFQVEEDGTYNFSGGNILAVFSLPFSPNNVCDNMLGGGGGVFNDANASQTVYVAPNFDLDLQAGVDYWVVVSTFEAGATGNYTININGEYSAFLMDAVYSPECEFAGCNDGGDVFPVPTWWDNCGGTLEVVGEEQFDGELCGTYTLQRTYRITDIAGMYAECTMEYYFFGIDLSNMTWPRNWDNLPGNNPMLECSDTDYPLDAYGNPHPLHTGYPEGYNEACGTIEVFYADRNFTSDCGPKILRDWTVVDDCTGEIYTHTQIIRITDSTPPVLNPKEGVMNQSTSAWSCDADYAVPYPEHFYDACDANPNYYVESSAGIVWQDPSTGAWYVFNMPIGFHTITYVGYDWCGNTVEAELYVNVYDGIPPIAVCEQYKQTSLTFDGTGTSKIWAEDFDSGSHDAGCGPVWFKVWRNDSGCETFNGDDNPGGGIDVWFDDYVKYCCDDVDTEVMTTLRVFDVDPGPGPVAPNRMEIGGDLYGHFNDCWTMVRVEEKVPPQMVCEDKYITCEDNYDPYLNPGLGEPAVFSTCGNYDLEYEDDLSRLDVCGIGYITRTWTVSVNGEAKGECRQRIYVEETFAFDPLTIVFPYVTSMECLADPTGGEPTWETNPCNVVDAEIVNIDTFQFVDDACYKILIDWVVIDWCVYEPNTGAELNVDEFRYISGNRRAILDPANFTEEDRDGYYKFTEVLMVYDQTPANITVADTCLGTATCATAPETYEVYASSYEDAEDCGGIYSWKYVIHNMATWEVVQYSYNNLEYKGNNYQGGVQGKSSKDELFGEEASLTILPALAQGQYRVLWTLNDGCSNTTQAYQYIEVADKKPPTPFMVDIATALMSNGMVEMTARFFDKGACNDDCLASYDNCSDVLYFTFTPVLPLIDHTWKLDAFGLFYFNPETGAKSNRNAYLAGTAHSWDPVMNTSGKIFTCDDTPAQYVDIYVWDKFALNEECDDGNYDFATVYLNLNDDGDCPDSGVEVAGMITANNSGEGIDDVTVTLENTNNNETHVAYTAAGAYAFDVNSDEYSVTPQKRNDWLNGVTTLDLVLIQKHLLGLVPLNGDNLIAADANANGSVSAADLFDLRKLILGVAAELANNDSWVFVPGAQDIIADTDMEVNFGGIKVGDVNGSATANANSVNVEARSANVINLVADEASVEAGMVEVAFTAENFANVYGAQFTMNVSGMTYAGVESGAINVSDVNFGQVREGVITMSWNNANGTTVADGTVLFTLKLQSSVSGTLSNLMSMSSDVTVAEAYTTEALDINAMNVVFRGAEEASFELYQNEPNPFTEVTVVGFSLPEAADYTLTVFDVTGKVVKVVTGSGQKGYNSETLDRKDIATGVMYYQLESNDYTATKKMIIIE